MGTSNPLHTLLIHELRTLATLLLPQLCHSTLPQQRWPAPAQRTPTESAAAATSAPAPRRLSRTLRATARRTAPATRASAARPATRSNLPVLPLCHATGAKGERKHPASQRLTREHS